MPPKFLEYLVILCFERRYPIQNNVASLKSRIPPTPNFLSPPPKFWAGYATGRSPCDALYLRFVSSGMKLVALGVRTRACFSEAWCVGVVSQRNLRLSFAKSEQLGRIDQTVISKTDSTLLQSHWNSNSVYVFLTVIHKYDVHESMDIAFTCSAKNTSQNICLTKVLILSSKAVHPRRHWMDSYGSYTVPATAPEKITLYGKMTLKFEPTTKWHV